MIAYNPDTGEIAQVPDDDSHMIEVSSEPPSDWRETDYLYDPDTDSYSKAPPEPSVAKSKLLEKVKKNWGWSDSKIRTLRTNYALMFDYIDTDNYDEAKNEATYAYNQNDITEAERDWIHDLLDGKK